MSRCRGIVVAGGHLEGTTSLNLQLSKDDAVSTLRSAVSFLDEAGVATTAVAAALVAKARGDEAMQAGTYAAAAVFYTEAIESLLAAELLAEMDAVPEEPQEPPVFRLRGRAAEQEEERVTPRRVKWLYEALVGRCLSRLAIWHVGNAADAADAADTADAAAAASLAVDALSDACDATLVCGLAGGGWYRRRDAAHASGNRAAAEEATAGLMKLGYALDVEGPPPTDAERKAIELAAARAVVEEEKQRAATQQRLEARAREATAAAAAAAAEAATAEEAARIEAEWNTPEAVAARAQAAATDALRVRLAEVRTQDWEELVYSHRWSGRARREGIFSGHVLQLSQLAEEEAAAAAAGAAGEALEEASTLLAEMEEAKRETE